jgi:hypothetical protein
VIQKVLGLVIVAGTIFFLNPLQIALAFSVLGQGHFLGAYYYQWKAGKMTARWLGVFALMAVVFFTGAVFLERLEFLALGASILFFIHHFQDEVTLFGKERSIFRTLEQLPPVLLYSALTADVLLGTALTTLAIYATAVVVALYLVAIIRRLHTPDILSSFLFLVTAGLALVWFSQIAVAPQILIGSVILFHYVSWYVYFYFRFAPKPERQWAYLQDMVVINILALAAFAVWMTAPWAAGLSYVFGPAFFYVWAILHILTSVRFADYRSTLRW